MKRALVERGRRFLMIALFTGASTIASHGAFAADTASAVASGKWLFQKHCSICHKSDGSGGVTLGNAISADLRAPALEHMYHDSDARLRRAILDGKNKDGEPLEQIMPRWRGQLTGREVTSIIAFLKTLHP